MYAIQLADPDFVLVKASWGIRETRSLLEKEETGYVICFLDGYILLSRAAFARCLDNAGGERVGDALIGQETTPVRDAAEDAATLPDRAVVVRDGVVLGFFELSRPRLPQRTRQASTGSSYFLGATFPGEVVRGSRFSVLVALGRNPRGQTHTRFDGEERLDLVIQVRAGLLVAEPSEIQAVVSQEEDPLPYQFRLEARDTGLALARVLVFYKGQPRGVLELAVRVVAQTDAELKPRQEQECLLQGGDTPEPDLTLLVLEQKGVGYTLSLQDRYGSPERLGPYPLAGVRNLVREVESESNGLPWDSPDKWRRAQHLLARSGQQLWRGLMPAEARIRLEGLVERVRTVHILSDEPDIPWELCAYGADSNQPRFLALEHELTRWCPGVPNRTTLPLRRMALVFPDSGHDCQTREERLIKLLGNADGRITSLPSSYPVVRDAMAAGLYDGWHFAGHGVLRDDRACELLFQDGKGLEPGDLTGSLRRFGEPAPLVFMNCCHSGRQTETTGWPERCLQVGAAAFVGTLRPVDNPTAFTFAAAFYANIFAGETLGTASLRARTAVRETGNPAWFAYTVFADPFARREGGACG